MHVTCLQGAASDLAADRTTFAASDSLRVRLFGRGATGSRPEASVDPVLMAAATVTRLQGIVSREVGGTETAVVTVGALRAGTKEDIIPDEAELLLSIRTFEEDVRMRVLAAVEAPRRPGCSPPPDWHKVGSGG